MKNFVIRLVNRSSYVYIYSVESMRCHRSEKQHLFIQTYLKWVDLFDANVYRLHLLVHLLVLIPTNQNELRKLSTNRNELITNQSE